MFLYRTAFKGGGVRFLQTVFLSLYIFTIAIRLHHPPG